MIILTRPPPHTHTHVSEKKPICKPQMNGSTGSHIKISLSYSPYMRCLVPHKWNEAMWEIYLLPYLFGEKNTFAVIEELLNSQLVIPLSETYAGPSGFGTGGWGWG